MNDENRTGREEDNPGTFRVPGVDREFNTNQILLVLLVPLAMVLIAVSSVNIALTTIGQSLNASDAQLQWVLSGFTLTVGITLVPGGRLGDLFGRGTLFIIGLTIFTIGAFSCGIAPTATLLNLARVVQGIGAGLLSPQSMGIIQQTFRGQARARAFGLFGMVVAVSVAIGPVLAGLVITLIGEDVGWRYTFFIHAPLGVLGIILALRWLPFERERAWMAQRRELRDKRNNHEPTPYHHRAFPDLDPVGGFLLMLGILGIMIPFTMHTFHWWLILAFVGAVGLLWAWIKWEDFYTRRGRFPMVDLNLLRIPSFSLGTAASGAYFLGSTSIFVILAMYLQLGLGENAFKAGMIGLPNAIVSAFAARWASERALPVGRPIVQISLASMLVGTVSSVIVVGLVGLGVTTFWWLLLTLAVTGFGQGAFGAANQTLAFDEVPVQHGGTAGGVKQTAERIATAIGNAIMTAIFFAMMPIIGPSNAVVLAFIAILFFQTIAFAIGHYDMRRVQRLAHD
ncbi:MAG: MFS transporter [Actinomycetaceae bacterium]|nr:MFS transporter [Actinomycetaceae bacterium]